MSYNLECMAWSKDTLLINVSCINLSQIMQVHYMHRSMLSEEY